MNKTLKELLVSLFNGEKPHVQNILLAILLALLALSNRESLPSVTDFLGANITKLERRVDTLELKLKKQEEVLKWLFIKEYNREQAKKKKRKRI